MLNKPDTDILRAVSRIDDDEIKNMLIELWGYRQLTRRIKGHMDTIQLEAMKIDTQLKMEVHIDTTELTNNP